ncbi:MAG: branched-chain amino acid ABC transporter permease, partial [Pseudomonadota bacterium]
MFYREAGQFKTTYEADSAKFPIFQDKVFIAIYLAIAFIAIPIFADQFFLDAVMIPFLVLAL